MTIFDLIFENIFFILIVLGFITSLIAKKNHEQSEAAKRRQQSSVTARPHRQRTPGIIFEDIFGFPIPQENEKVNPPYESTTRAEPEFEPKTESKPTIYENMNSESTPYIVNLPNRNEGLSFEKSRNVESTKGNSPILDQDSSPIYQDEIKTTRHNALIKEPLPTNMVQGMMWAEIFGPPRAKKPYRGGPDRN